MSGAGGRIHSELVEVVAQVDARADGRHREDEREQIATRHARMEVDWEEGGEGEHGHTEGTAGKDRAAQAVRPPAVGA